ncbi:hypothetical protein Tco_0751194 [Tanacetum coccineum]|uniref:Uncharacterized protein n=1 Tax=Tanacetum coccineum TaxID=301880 RepID=A0ABQ4Z6Z9_9ASTR
MKILDNKLESLKILENKLESLKLQENQPEAGLVLFSIKKNYIRKCLRVAVKERIVEGFFGGRICYRRIGESICGVKGYKEGIGEYRATGGFGGIFWWEYRATGGIGESIWREYRATGGIGGSIGLQ